MTTYSYSIFIDQQQLDELDDKIRKLESLSGDLDVGDEGFITKIQDILKLSQIGESDKKKLDIDEMNSGIAYIKDYVKRIFTLVEGLEIDEDKIASVMAKLAKQEGAGDIMGTKPMHDLMDRLEKLSTGETTIGPGPAQITPDQFLADMKANALFGQDMSFLAERGDIDLEAIGATQVLNDPKFFRNLFELGNAYAAVTATGVVMADKTKEIQDALQLNEDIFAKMKLDDKDLWSEEPYYYRPGAKEGERTLLGDMDQSQWANAIRKVIDDDLVEIAKSLSLVQQGVDVESELEFTSSKLPPGWNTQFAAELQNIANFIAEIQGTMMAISGQGFTPEELEERVTTIFEAMADMLSIDPTGKTTGYTRIALAKLHKMSQSFKWENELDMITDFLLAFEGISEGMKGGEASMRSLQAMLGIDDPSGRPADVTAISTNFLAGRSTDIRGESIMQGLSAGTISMEDLENFRKELNDMVAQTGPSPTIKDLAGLTSAQKDLIGEVQEAVYKMTATDVQPESDMMSTIEDNMKKLSQNSDDMDNTILGLIKTLEGIMLGVNTVIGHVSSKPSGPGEHGI